MIAIGELRETYWAADFLYRLFSNAQNKLDSRKRSSGTRESELDRVGLRTPDSTVYPKEPAIQENSVLSDFLLPDKFFSNPFLRMPDEYTTK